MTRTAIGTAAGGRTQLTSLTAAAAVLVVLFAARPLLAAFPLAALAALVIYAAIRLIDLPALRRLLTFRRGGLIIAISACLGVLTLGILDGVLVAIGVSVAELLLRVARPHDAILRLVPGLAGMHDVDDYPQVRTIPGLVVYRYDAPLFFANAQDFRRRALAAARRDGAARWFVLNVEANIEVDLGACRRPMVMTVTISLPMLTGRQAGGSYAGGTHLGALRLTRHCAGAVDLLQQAPPRGPVC